MDIKMGILRGRRRGDGGRERMESLGNRGRQVQGGRHVGWIGRRVNRLLPSLVFFAFWFREHRQLGHLHAHYEAFLARMAFRLVCLLFPLSRHSSYACVLYLLPMSLHCLFQIRLLSLFSTPHISLSVSSSSVFCLVSLAVLFSQKCSLSLAWPHVRVRYRFISWLLAVTYVFFSFCGCVVFEQPDIEYFMRGRVTNDVAISLWVLYLRERLGTAPVEIFILVG